MNVPPRTQKEGVTRWHAVRAERLNAEHLAARLHAEEKELYQWLCKHLPLNKDVSIQHGTATLEERLKVVMLDPEKVFYFAAKEKRPDLLISRINEKTVREFGKKVPGVSMDDVTIVVFRSF